MNSVSGRISIRSPTLFPFSLLLGAQYIFTSHIFLRWLESDPLTTTLVSAVFYFASISAALNLLLCACSDPGQVPHEWSEANLSHVRFLTSGDRSKFLAEHPQVAEHYCDKAELNAGTTQIYEYCRECRLVLPPAAGHCEICGRCVLSWEHHCTWLGNCVGLRNRKFSLLFTVYSSLVGLIPGLLLLPDTIRILAVHRAESLANVSSN